MIAESPAMKKIKQTIEAPACAGCPIYLVGESGTGKKTVARYMHAYHQKKGLFVAAGIEDAENARDELLSLPVSTLFITLDSPANETTVRSVGELAKTAAARDIQLVIASDTLVLGIEGGEWFENAVIVPMPGLGSRVEDIEAISRQFLAEFHQTLGTQPVKIRQDALEEIIHSPAGKNLASLKSYIKGLALLEKGFVIERNSLQQVPFTPKTIAREGILHFTASDTLKEIEQKLIEQVLKEEDFNQTKAAKRLDINRATLWRKLKK
jgi:DNA-binding NtrC family response regulator